MSKPSSAVLRGKRFEQARSALISWANFDDGQTEFYTKDLIMYDRRVKKAIAAVIEYQGGDKPAGTQVGFIVVTKKFSSMLTGTHLIVEEIPLDGNWKSVHQKNLESYDQILEFIYGQNTELEEKAQEILAVRRQLLIYRMIFPDANVKITISDSERLMIVDAKLMGTGGEYTAGLAELVAKFGGESDGNKG